MDFIVNYWAQLTVILGIIGYIMKIVLDYRMRNKELKFKHFYELKSNKIMELYSKIVEIQIIIDRRKKDSQGSFESNIFKNRIELDRYYWESEFYFSPRTKRYFRGYLENLKFFEATDMIAENKDIEMNFRTLTKALVKEFKNELK